MTSISCFFLLLFSLHLFFAKQGNQLLNRLLAMLFLSRFGQLLVLMLINANQIRIFPFFHQLSTPLFYAAPACFYLYIISFIHGRTGLRKLDWLHFIPFVLAIIHVCPWTFIEPADWKMVAKQIKENKHLFISERNGLFPAYFYYLGRPALLLGYLSASWYAVLKSKELIRKLEDSAREWIFFALNVATFFQLFSLLPLITHGMREPMVNISFVVVNCLALLAVIIFIFHQPKIFYGYLFVAVDWGRKSGVVSDLIRPVTLSKKLSLPPDQLSSYPKIMKEFMEAEKPYLLKEFQIIDLAKGLNISVHHCSFVINNVFGKNFRDWINGHRVVYFMGQYPLKSDKMTIEAIAYESGFKSMATFYNAFKKETGLMPTAYFSLKKEALV